MAKNPQKPVHNNITINVSPDRIWQVISSPGNLEYFHPFCESNPVEKWPGGGSVDYVNYYNGLKYVRNFIGWDNGIGYELLIGKRNGKKSKVVWQIEKIGSTLSCLNITIYPHEISRYPKFTKPFLYYLIIKPSLQKYLSSVLNGFQWYITKNERVKKNQFGTHKWFSN